MTATVFEKSSVGRIGYSFPKNDVDLKIENIIPAKYRRKEDAQLPELSELDVIRHYIELSQKNHCVEKGMYPLGSCTMKYNPKINEVVARDLNMVNLHPKQPESTVQGALELMYDLQNDLAEIAGMKNATIQPAAGAQGEFTGLKIIAAYHKSKGNLHKKNIFMPDSAHGTNPASCALAGFTVKEIKSDEFGKVDVEALRSMVDENTAGFMLTNPNTLGLFENQIEEISSIIHGVDGVMYMDGANFNALLGIVQPGKIGFDVMHYNIHKTFATPHGGGGPGIGAVGCVDWLEEFLPAPMACKADDGHYYLNRDNENSIGKVHTYYGNFSIAIRAYTYIKMLGAKGIRRAGEFAVINANYIQAKLKPFYNITHGDQYCMHEFVADSSIQKKKYGVTTLDIAKRLLDKGFHAPTVYFPLIIHEAIMIEPTETEPKQELDRFINAMIEINEEIEKDPESLKHTPYNTPIRRVDDVRAVKHLKVRA